MMSDLIATTSRSRRAVASWLAGVLAVAMMAAVVQTAPADGTVASSAGGTRLLGWGDNEYSQLGGPRTTSPTPPTPIGLPAGVDALRVVGDDEHTLALGSDGHAYEWGSYPDPDGVGRTHETATAVDLPGTVVSISTDGVGADLAATADGTIYRWGLNQTSDVSHEWWSYPAPESLSLPQGVKAISVSAAWPWDVALGDDHRIYQWKAQLSPDGAGGFASTSPVELHLPGDVLANDVQGSPDGFVPRSKGSYVALAQDGTVYTWGNEDRGGVHLTATPTRVSLPDDAAAVAIGAAWNHFFALDSTGRLLGWGGNNFGQLGVGPSPIIADTPLPVAMPAGVTVTSFAAEYTHALAIGSDGKLYGWGSQCAGDLQNPDGGVTPLPLVQPPPSGARAFLVGVGACSSFAVVGEGQVPPRFAAASPPDLTQPGAFYSYQFQAIGQPAPTFSLSSDAPSWLHVDATTGVLSGTTPIRPFRAHFSVTATNSAGNQTIGPYTLISGEQVPITGTVLASPGDPVANSRVEACAGQACSATQTASDGTFSLPWYAGVDVAVTAYPPPGSATRLLSAAQPTRHVPASGLALEPMTLPRVQAPAPVIPDYGDDVVHWANPLRVTYADCAGGLGLASLIAQNSQTLEYEAHTSAVTDSTGAGHYAAALPPPYPLHGAAELRTTTVCPENTPHTWNRSGRGAPRGDASGPGAAVSADAVDAVIGAVYKYGPNALKVLDHIDLAKSIAEIFTKNGCEADAAIWKTALGAVLAPLVEAFVDASLPIVTDVVIGLLGASVVGILGVFVVAAIIRVAWPYIISKTVEFYINAAVDAAYKNYCHHGLEPNLLIDPSGTVLDTHGNPVSGATTTLMRADSPAGPFAAMDASDPGVEPHVNPETTGADGAFHWDVRTGYYEIQASAPGCHDPTDLSNASTTLGPLPVPPPQVGLFLTLDCPGSSPPSAPTVTAVDTTLGPPAGGTVLNLTGTGFTPTMTATIGNTSVADVTFLGPTTARVTTPAGTGHGIVHVATAGGTNATGPEFTWSAPAAVTGVTPNHGPLGGGTPVVVRGTGFEGATGVSFGALPAASFTVVSDSQVTATAPPGEANGVVDIHVINASGASPTSAGDQFGYDSRPSPGGADLHLDLHAPRLLRGHRPRTLVVTVTNRGPDAATGVATRLSVPRGLVLVSGPGVSRPTRTAVLLQTTLGAGALDAYRFKVRNQRHRAGRVWITVSTKSSVTDSAPDDNLARAHLRLAVSHAAGHHRLAVQPHPVGPITRGTP